MPSDLLLSTIICSILNWPRYSIHKYTCNLWKLIASSYRRVIRIVHLTNIYLFISRPPGEKSRKLLLMRFRSFEIHPACWCFWQQYQLLQPGRLSSRCINPNSSKNSNGGSNSRATAAAGAGTGAWAGAARSSNSRTTAAAGAGAVVGGNNNSSSSSSDSSSSSSSSSSSTKAAMYYRDAHVIRFSIKRRTLKSRIRSVARVPGRSGPIISGTYCAYTVRVLLSWLNT